jgi:bis(5'-nucleosyl)-tetraphosphatase (symmetrical)
MNYLIGDIQGCSQPLNHLLQILNFSRSRDHLFVLGDLINRGPDSLGTLTLLQNLGASVTCVLGNHDWHLLATAEGVRPAHRHDTLAQVLSAPDHTKHLHWLKQQHMAVLAHGWLMVHAGVVPQWDTAMTLQLAAELEDVLRGPDLGDFLRVMYSNQPDLWSPHLSGVERLRFTLNVLTRIRFIEPQGRLNFSSKESASAAPAGCVPWFEALHRLTEQQNIAFGHWSSLGLLNRPHLLGIDTGCIWGRCLTAVRLQGDTREFIQVPCPQVRLPA